MVGAMLSHSIPQTTTTRPGLSAIAIYRSDGACRGHGTIAETLAGCGRPMLVVWVLAELLPPRVVSLEMIILTIKLNILLFFSVCFARCVCRTLSLFFEVDSLILAKQLARHLSWACRSENLIALHQQCVHVCDSLSALHISWDIRHFYREFNQTADTLFNQAIDERDSNDFSAFW